MQMIKFETDARDGQCAPIGKVCAGPFYQRMAVIWPASFDRFNCSLVLPQSAIEQAKVRRRINAKGRQKLKPNDFDQSVIKSKGVQWRGVRYVPNASDVRM